MPTRRQTMTTAAAAALGGFALPAWAAGSGDSYPTAGGQLVIHPVNHASFVMETPTGVVYNDPVGDPALYADLPPAGLILVTHEHPDHFNVDTLTALAGDTAVLVTNPAVHDKLPAALQARATALANGDKATALGLSIVAVPAYNTTPDRLKYHPKGRDNGYVLGVDGSRVYIAGDTEDTPEMRAQSDIDIAFVPMNLPYTMTVEQAADAVNAFRPKVVYPYHYKGQDPKAFAALVNGPKVVFGPWYA